MKKLVIDEGIPYLRDRLKGKFDCLYLQGESITAADLRDADGLIVRTRTRCNAPLLQSSPLTFIASATIGIDHIDSDYCASHSIEVVNAPGCNAPAVAQYVWSALLSLGFDPKRERLGIVGKGNVGSIVAEWGRALGTEIMVCDPPRRHRGLRDENYLPLEELMSHCDAVTFHVPLIRVSQHGVTPTYHLADNKMLSNMRKGGIIINAARGGVIDEKALIRLKEERDLKCVIDCWEQEPRITPESLEMADIATPHIAGYSEEGKQRASAAVLKALEQHFNIPLDITGLPGPYENIGRLTDQSILDSYDIFSDDKLLRNNPAGFESLRNHYHLRKELKSDKEQTDYVNPDKF